MESFNLKSSKFDVSQEGKINVYYRHPERDSIKVGTSARYASRILFHMFFPSLFLVERLISGR